MNKSYQILATVNKIKSDPVFRVTVVLTFFNKSPNVSLHTKIKACHIQKASYDLDFVLQNISVCYIRHSPSTEDFLNYIAPTHNKI